MFVAVSAGAESAVVISERGENPNEQHSAANSAAVAVVYSDGSVVSVSLAGSEEQQQKSEVVKLVRASSDADRAVAATAVDESGSRLAVILGSEAGGFSAQIHSLQVRCIA